MSGLHKKLNANVDEYSFIIIGVFSAFLYYLFERILDLNENLTVMLTIGLLLLFSLFAQMVINKMKRARLEAERNERKFRMLAENMNDLVWTLDNNLHVTYMSPSSLTLLGFEPGDLIGSHLDRNVSRTSYAYIKRRIGEHFFSKDKVNYGPLTFEYQHVTRKGGIIWMEGKLGLMFDSAGHPAGFQCLSRDISERKQAELELLKTQDLLKDQLKRAQKLETIGILTSGIAHDFNNILASVTSSAELAMDIIPEDIPEYSDMQRILRVSKRGKSLVRRILSFTGKKGDDFRPLDMSREIQETIQFLHATLPSSIKLNVDVDPQAGVVMGDSIQLQQIVLNLVTNSLHALDDVEKPAIEIEIKEWDGRPDVGLETKPGKEYVMVRVSDNGKGIDRDNLAKIFDPFFTTKGEQEGTGLGLSVVQSIIDDHGGRITVDSVQGQQTTFTILLPKIEAATDFRKREDKRESEVGGKEAVLFVDDDNDVLDALGKILGGLGYSILKARDGTTGYELFLDKKDLIDLVIADHDMPDMTGAELSSKISEIDPDIPIILMTGTMANDLLADLPQITEVIHKPVERKELARSIRRALEAH